MRSTVVASDARQSTCYVNEAYLNGPVKDALDSKERSAALKKSNEINALEGFLARLK